MIYTDNMGAYTSTTGIEATKQFKFNHVKEICLLFPRRQSDYTVQLNPCYEHLCSTMFNRDYPDKETDTTSGRFLRSQLEAMSLDAFLHCTESLEHSYCAPPCHLFPVRDRSLADNTDFVFVIPLERQSANAFFFDGLDSGANTENVTLTGKFITDPNTNVVLNMYALPDNRNNNTDINNTPPNRTPPIIALVSDTFWLFSSRDGGTVEYVIRETWDELFSKRFPQIYQRLQNEYLSKVNTQ
jgi:hypothetical protein